MTNTTPEEDEEFELIERKQQAKKSYGSLVMDNLKEAKLSAERFVADNTVKELGNISLLMAYELGYRAAMYAAERKKNE
jgi:hypothetical protein